MNSDDHEQTELLRAIWNEMKALGSNLGARIDRTNSRLDAVVETMDRRFGETNDRLDQTNARLDQSIERLDQSIERLGVVEQVLRELAGQQVILGRFVRNLVDADIGDLRTRLARVEAKLAG